MLYKNVNVLSKSRYNLAINFMVYRVVRMLFELKIITQNELEKHKRTIRTSAPIGVSIDFEKYRIWCNEVDYEQF